MSKKNQQVKMPKWMSPIQDLIPNEVLYDVFKMNIWVSSFICAYGLITSFESASDKSKSTKAFGTSLYSIAKMASPAMMAVNFLVGDENRTGAGMGVVVDWKRLAKEEKNQGNELGAAVMTFFANDFYRRAIIASGIASAVVYSMFETKIIENLPNLAPESISVM